MEDILDKFNVLTQKPVKYLTVQHDVKDDVKNLVKSVYDFTKRQGEVSKKKSGSALPELIVEEFDEEQIWQQIELQNTECWDKLVWEVANCMTLKDKLKFPVNISEAVEDHDDDEEASEDVDDNLQDSEVSEADIEEEKPKKKQKENQSTKSKPEKVKETPLKQNKQDKSKSIKKSSIVDDDFFKLNEMEQFLLKEEKMESKKDKPDRKQHDSDEESIDMFEDMDDEDLDEEEGGGKEMMYYDFFSGQDEGPSQEQGEQNSEDDDGMDEDFNDVEEDIDEDNEIRETQVKDKSKSKKKVTFADASSDDNDSVSDEEVPKIDNTNREVVGYVKKSEFELRQQRLNERINKLEEKALTDAPWQLKGEIDATKRPQNSLLQEVLDFDLTSRPAPIITEQTTLTLEDIIRRRVKDKAWDDVVKKEKPVDDQLSFRKTEVLDHSKSKQSLAQIYEAEYLKQKQAASGEVEEEKEPEAHTQIRDAMSKLFAKLDALTHYHYTPRAPQAEVKIITNAPAISMEEVAPVATSDATLLAPEEIKRKNRGELISKEERTQTDKNRERRKKKQLQKKKGKVEKVTEHRNTKKGVEASDKSLKTSKAFFQQLNDDATSAIKNKRNVKNKGQ